MVIKMRAKLGPEDLRLQTPVMEGALIGFTSKAGRMKDDAIRGLDRTT